MLTCDASAGTKAGSGEQFVNCLDLSISGSSPVTESPQNPQNPSPSPSPTPTPVTSENYVLPSIQNGPWSCANQGYNCQSASDAFGGGGNSGDANSHTYACVDWSVGSYLWENQQCVYRERTNDDVHFGVGSFGTPSDNTMGKCYRMQIAGMSSPVIAQVVNTGSDVHSGQFDLQMMAGGIGLCNALTSHVDGFTDGETSGDAMFPMFAGDNTVWGPKKYGGFEHRDGCDNIPMYPDAVSSSPFYNNEMDLQSMCRRSFELGARVDSGANPVITSGVRVACPEELYKVTGLRLLSDDSFTDNEEFTNGGMTRMFDGMFR